MLSLEASGYMNQETCKQFLNYEKIFSILKNFYIRYVHLNLLLCELWQNMFSPETNIFTLECLDFHSSKHQSIPYQFLTIHASFTN